MAPFASSCLLGSTLPVFFIVACFFLSCHVLMSHVCSRAIGSGGGIGTHNHKANNDMECDALVSYVCAYHDVRLV